MTTTTSTTKLSALGVSNQHSLTATKYGMISNNKQGYNNNMNYNNNNNNNVNNDYYFPKDYHPYDGHTQYQAW